MKLQYIVTVDLDKFIFENGAEALKFTELAVQNFAPSTFRDKTDVYMNIKAEEPDNAESEETEG